MFGGTTQRVYEKPEIGVRKEHEPTCLFDRPDRCSVGTDRPPRAAAEARGPARHGRPSRDRQRDLLPAPNGLRLADAAARLPVLEHRALLLLALAQGRHVAKDP